MNLGWLVAEDEDKPGGIPTCCAHLAGSKGANMAFECGQSCMRVPNRPSFSIEISDLLLTCICFDVDSLHFLK